MRVCVCVCAVYVCVCVYAPRQSLMVAGWPGQAALGCCHTPKLKGARRYTLVVAAAYTALLMKVDCWTHYMSTPPLTISDDYIVVLYTHTIQYI